MGLNPPPTGLLKMAVSPIALGTPVVQFEAVDQLASVGEATQV